MKNYKTLAVISTLASASLIFIHSATGQTVVSSPVATQQLSPKIVWLKAEVIHFDTNSIIVREAGDERMIHTFTYSPKVQPQMQKEYDKGGYQYGDTIKIRYEQGQTVALAIHGKASKPATPAPVAPHRPTPASS